MTAADGVNAFEAVWWPVLGAALLIRSLQSPVPWRLPGVIAAISLFVFGVSDVIELWSKAWWRPWWLLVMKGICLITLAICGSIWWRLRRRWPRGLSQDHIGIASGDS